MLHALVVLTMNLSSFGRSAALAVAASCVAGAALATPSTVFWAPSTPAVQPAHVLHVTYDSYFARDAAYPVDVGLEVGLLHSTHVQAEVGFDALFPTFSPEGSV